MQRVLIIAIAGLFLSGAALAQSMPQPSPGAAPAAPAPKPKGKAATAPQTPEGIECSKQADAKGLHGQERVRFRANCKKKLLKEKG